MKLDLDLGWNICLRNVNCRIYGIDAPEMSTVAGRQARNYAMELLPDGTEVEFKSHSLDKYGRPLGTVTLASGRDFATLMLAAGHGIPYFGGKRD